jgi:hypothetical protein
MKPPWEKFIWNKDDWIVFTEDFYTNIYKLIEAKNKNEKRQRQTNKIQED